MAVAVEDLVRTAKRLANEGRWPEAEETWREVHRLDPSNGQALFGLGVHALQNGDAEGATAYLAKACEVSPRDLLCPLTLAQARRAAGDAQGEFDAIERTLSVDSYFLPGLLARADFLERFGKPAAVAAAYANCLKVAPPRAHWPDVLRQHLEHAQAYVDAHVAAYEGFLHQRLGAAMDSLPPAIVERWREAASILAGRSKPYASMSNQLHVPRLPAIPFFDRAHFPWASALESRTDAIRSELLRALDSDRDRFAPYIAYGPSDPVNQWRELNHSQRWSTYSLWRNGLPDEEARARCPETVKALASVEMAGIEGLCPNVMFSALAPRTCIPPHHGETNARLVAHLPLIVPENCSYRVGFDWRRWEVGKLLVFDDTIEHEARNDSDELRVILIFDVWNPLLSAEERALVQAMTGAARTFSARDRREP